MNSLEDLIAQIPVRHDPVSYLVFSGVVFGLTLAGTIWMRGPLHNRALHYYALLMLCLSLVTLDTFLCYTGWMKYTLHLNDSSEPLTLLLAPLLYLCVRFLILRRPLPPLILALHFLPAILYALSQIGYYSEPLAVKFNAYKDAYFDAIPFADVPAETDYAYQGIKNLHRWLILTSFTFYGLFSLTLWLNHRKAFGRPAGRIRISKYRFTRFVLAAFFCILALLLIVYLNYEDDGGDHYITLFIFAITLFSSIAFLSESRFFQKTWLIDKYETQSVSENTPSLEAVSRAVEEEDFFASPSASLKMLAAQFETHPNTISRLINQETGGNFNDYLNSFRIDLARERLLSEAYRHLTIEGIGQSVGFRSKSSFYQAFKKQTGKSPSQFVREARTS